MKSFMETFKEENAETEYCAYCLELKGGKYTAAKKTTSFRSSIWMKIAKLKS